MVENDDECDAETPNKWKKFKTFLGKFGIFRAWRSFDNRFGLKNQNYAKNVKDVKRIFSLHFLSFMKPLLTNSLPALTDTMPRFLFPLANLLTTNEQVSMVT